MSEREKWRPIETAAHSGEPILGVTKDGFVTLAKWTPRFHPDYGDTSPGWYCLTLDRRVDLAFWMPLPEPPKP